MSTEQEILSQAMAIARARRDPEKLAANARAAAKARKDKPLSEEHKAKLREAQHARREREKAERAALGLDAAAEKKPVGRPRKSTEDDTHTPKRPRGRPKKSETTVETPNAIDAPEK